MLDGLKNSLGDAIKKIVKSSGIDEELIKDLCKDVQRALLTVLFFLTLSKLINSEKIGMDTEEGLK